MKLEIKHLAPYLPYGLKAKFQAKNKKTCRKYVTLSVSFSKGLRGSSCRNTLTLERRTQLIVRTKTLIDDTLCYNPFLL